MIEDEDSFKHAWRARQFCLIPVDWFYEPRYGEDGKAVRWAIRREDGEPFCLAGIWERRKDDQGEWQRSFSMITINATHHPLMKHFHGPNDEKRSVVVLPPERYASWLACKVEDEARDHLQPMDAKQFTAAAAPKPPREKAAPAAE